MTSYNISSKIVDEFLQLVPSSSTILELGTGEGTKLLAEHFNVISIENDPKYHVGCSELLYVPLVSPQVSDENFKWKFPDATIWYDSQILKTKLIGKTYSAILVDGPPSGATRCWLWYFYDKIFDTTVPVILDDVHRQYEWKVALKIASVKNQPTIEVKDAHLRKAFAIIK